MDFGVYSLIVLVVWIGIDFVVVDDVIFGVIDVIGG